MAGVRGRLDALSRTRRRTILGIGIVVYLAMLGGLVLVASGGGRPGVAAGSMLVIATALPALARLRRDPLDAPGLWAGAAALTFGALSLLWIGEPNIPPPGIDRDDVSRALLLVAGGVAACSLGALVVARPRRRAPLVVAPEHLPPPRLLVGLFLVGGAGLVAGMLLGAVGFDADAGETSGILPFAQFITQLGGLGFLVIGVTAVAAFTSRSSVYVRLLVVFMAVQVAGGFVAGYKSQSLAPLLLSGLVYVAARQRVPWRALAITAGVTVLVLVPANSVYRTVLRPNPNVGAPPATPLTVAQDTLAYAKFRFRLIDHVALIDDRTPDVYAHGNGNRYVLLPALVIVPRPLWPDKPILNDGLEFSHTYWEIPVNTETATPLTQPGDLLRNFGPGGVMVGLALWGAFLGAVLAAQRHWRSPRVEWLYLVFVVTVVGYVESDIPQLVAGAAKTLFVAAVIAWLLLPGRAGPAGHVTLRRWAGSLNPVGLAVNASWRTTISRR
jgi:hypothetical protein